jgi:hypothetical protein
MGRPPIIGYHDLLVDGTVSGDGTNPENAYDQRTDDAWATGAASGYLETVLGSADTCDYMAVVGHTLATRSATIKAQYWTGAAYSDIPGATATPTADTAFMVLFPQSVSTTKFKIVVTTDGSAATLAVVQLGNRLNLQRGIRGGYSSPRFARDDQYYNAITVGGKLTGRSLISSGVSGTLQLSNLDSEWVRTDLEAFLTASRTRGWFVMWHPDEYDDEVAYCYTTGTPRPSEQLGAFANCSIGYVGVTA